MRDVAAIVDSVRWHHGFDTAGPPEGWLDAEYIAGASARPDIGDYLRSYVSYANALDTVETLADSLIARRFRERYQNEAERIEMENAFKRGFHGSRLDRLAFNGVARNHATSSLKLHEFLVSVDERVIPGVNDEVEFSRYNERLEYRRLNMNLQVAARNLEAIQQRMDRDSATRTAKPASGRRARP